MQGYNAGNYGKIMMILKSLSVVAKATLSSFVLAVRIYDSDKTLL